MSNYNESNVSGQSWNRCFKIEVDNPYDKPPTCKMFEEEIIVVGDKSVSTISRIFSPEINMSDTIALINPITGEPIGASITHQDLYVALFSLYINTAVAQDVKESGFVNLDAENVPPSANTDEIQ